MPSHKSAAKRMRQSVKKNAVNRARRSQVLSASKLVDSALVKGDKQGVDTALRSAVSMIAKASNKGTFHWKTAARKTSRLAQRAKKAALATKA